MRFPPASVLASDALYPRDEEHRYRLYGRKGDDLIVLACTPTPGGVGCAIVQFHEDAKQVGGELGDHGQIGVLDAVAGEWIVKPFNRPGP